MIDVVGLDLSLTATGICTSNGAQLLTPPKKLDGLDRLRWIRDAVHDTVVMLRIADDGVLVVVEGLSYASHTGKANERAGLWWLVADRLTTAWFHPAVVSPAGRAKYATGRGNAPKDAVMLEAARRLPDLGIVDNNTADAAILYAAGCDHLGRPLCVMPAAHRVALDAVTWPTW